MYYPLSMECNKVEETLYSPWARVSLWFNCHPSCGRRDLRKSAKTIYGFCEFTCLYTIVVWIIVFIYFSYSLTFFCVCININRTFTAELKISCIVILILLFSVHKLMIDYIILISLIKLDSKEKFRFIEFKNNHWKCIYFTITNITFLKFC